MLLIITQLLFDQHYGRTDIELLSPYLSSTRRNGAEQQSKHCDEKVDLPVSWTSIGFRMSSEAQSARGSFGRPNGSKLSGSGIGYFNGACRNSRSGLPSMWS